MCVRTHTHSMKEQLEMRRSTKEIIDHVLCLNYCIDVVELPTGYSQNGSWLDLQMVA